jgi:hypothetical protein
MKTCRLEFSTVAKFATELSPAATQTSQRMQSCGRWSHNGCQAPVREHKNCERRQIVSFIVDKCYECFCTTSWLTSPFDGLSVHRNNVIQTEPTWYIVNEKKPWLDLVYSTCQRQYEPSVTNLTNAKCLQPACSAGHILV